MLRCLRAPNDRRGTVIRLNLVQPASGLYGQQLRPWCRGAQPFSIAAIAIRRLAHEYTLIRCRRRSTR